MIDVSLGGASVRATKNGEHSRPLSLNDMRDVWNSTHMKNALRQESTARHEQAQISHGQQYFRRDAQGRGRHDIDATRMRATPRTTEA